MNQQNLNEPQFAVPQQEGGMDIKKWMFRIIRLWPWIILSLIVCSICSYTYIRCTEPIFKSSASVMVEDKNRGGSSLENPMLKDLNLSGTGKFVENEIVVLKSRDLMKDVVLKEQLYILIKRKGTFSDRTVYRMDLPIVMDVLNPETISSFIPFQLFRKGGHWMISKNSQKPFDVQFGSRYMIGTASVRFFPNALVTETGRAEAEDNYTITLMPVNIAIGENVGKLQVEAYNKSTSILTLTMIDNEPQKVSATLGTLIGIYSLHGLAEKNKETANAVNFLDGRLDTVENILRKVEGDVESFQKKNNMIDIATESNRYLDNASTTDVQKATQETQIEIINELERSLMDKKDTTVASSLGISEPSLGGFIQKYNLLILEKQRLAQQMGAQNPFLINLENQIKDTKASLLQSVRSLRGANNITLRNTASRNAEMNSRVSVVPQLQRELIQIKRSQSVQEQLYLFLLQKKEESAIKLASSTMDTRTVEQPYSLGQIKPINKDIWTMGIFMGFLLPIAGLALAVFFDNKVEDKKEVEKNTFAPLLGQISYVKKASDNPIQIKPQSRSIVAEQLRSIRTSISYTGKGESTKRILVTSQGSGEGKSFVSLNLAASYAQLGKKVVVLEFDLRKPSIAISLGIDPKIGISTFLSRDMDIDEIIIPISGTDDNLFLLPAGPLPPNPAELILGQNMVKMMKKLNERFDYIIIDSPPFSIITDATLLQQFADINLVVLRQGYSFKNVYQEINQRIQQFPTQPMYVILNGVGKGQAYRYDPSYNSYGYGYFEDDKKNLVQA